MAYLGNPDLSIEAQERVTAAFRQVVANLQRSQREEAMIGLEFVLRIDPDFGPAVNLQKQLASGADELDLSDLIGQLEAPSTDAINELLVEAVEAFNRRNFVEAKNLVERVLIELPGQPEARQLLAQLDEALKVEKQVGQFLAQAREALSKGDAQEAANFVMMAQALDPHHGGITATLQEIHAGGGLRQDEPVATGPASEAGPFASPQTPGDAAQPSAGPVVPPARQGDSDVPVWDAGPARKISFGDDAPEPPAAPEDGVFPAADLEMSESDAEPLTEAVNAAEAFAEVPEADDMSDLFDAGPEPATGQSEETNSDVAQLMSRGRVAYESGQFLEAIDAWSRVYLVDPSNHDVKSMIEAARNELNSVRREVEHLLFDAEDAVIGGDTDKAMQLVEQVLAQHPSQPEALELKQRLIGGTAPHKERRSAPTGSAMPDLDDDLFSEPFDDSAVEPPVEAEVESFDDDFDDFAGDFGEPPAAKRILGLSPRTLVMAALALAALLALTYTGSRLLGGGGADNATDVYTVRNDADALFKGGDAAGAIQLMETYEPADETEQQLVNMALTKYRAALATPTPTPIPASAVEARALLAAGLWFRAYDIASVGLEGTPGDPGLQDIIAQIEQQEPRVKTLRTQMSRANYRGAATTARDLLQVYPEQRDLTDVLGRNLFNAALAELRTYNLTGASTHLNEFDALHPNDDEVERVLEFINRYKARPVDMQLKVFIQSLSERHGWTDLSQPVAVRGETAVTVEPTPTPEAPAS